MTALPIPCPRVGQSHSIRLSKPEQMIDGQTAWSLALEGKGFHTEIDAASSLKEEFQKLEGRRRFVTEALAFGVMALDACRGRCSVELCQQIRPEWVAEIKVILECLKKISEANTSLDRMRHELVGFQREASENFPEVAGAAGMSIKSKLAALAKREERFNNQGEQNETSIG